MIVEALPNWIHLNKLFIVVPRECGKDLQNGLILTKINCLTPWNTKLHCDTLIRMYRAGEVKPSDIVYCAGGIFLPTNFQSIPVGKIMAEYLLSSGIPKAQIITENTSVTTGGMIVSIKDVLSKNHIDISQFLIVSIAHRLHNMKILLLCKRQNIAPVQCVNVSYKLSAKDIVHDVITYILTMVDSTDSLNLYKKEKQLRILRQKSIWS